MSRACGTVVATAGAVVAIVSWPGLARPPTTLPPSAPPVVDGRHRPAMTQGGHKPVISTHMRYKAGQDTEQMGPPARYFTPMGRRPGIHAFVYCHTVRCG